MHTKIRPLTAAAMALAFIALTIQPAFSQITLSGTVPVGHAGLVLIQPNNMPKSAGALKFKFAAPQAGAYAFDFCIGPPSNPCGLATSYVVNVPAGEQRLAVVDASAFISNELVVVQGTNTPLPFSVTIE